MRSDERIVDDVLDVGAAALNADREVQGESRVPAVQHFERHPVALFGQRDELRIVELRGRPEPSLGAPRGRFARDEPQPGGIRGGRHRHL